MTTGTAPAKINLALVVGPRHADGKHELVTVYQRVGLCDVVSVEPGAGLRVTGFAEDTLVTQALELLAATTATEPRWHVHIEKSIPVSAGLGGGSSDAAAALRLANASLGRPLDRAALHELAAGVGSDVPLFLADPGPLLGTGDGTTLEPLSLPLEHTVLLIVPHRVKKESTAAVYAAFDERRGEKGFVARRSALHDALTARDVRRLPRNDLASSPLASEIERLGAVRADVSGAGPAVYGLFDEPAVAEGAARALEHHGNAWICPAKWYG